jgi:hypothetical protein
VWLRASFITFLITANKEAQDEGNQRARRYQEQYREGRALIQQVDTMMSQLETRFDEFSEQML